MLMEGALLCSMRGFVCHLNQLFDVRLYMESPEICSGILFEGWPNIQTQLDPHHSDLANV